LHASLLGRLDRLGPAARTVAQVAAAIGRDFSYELLAAAAPLAEPELREALRRLVEAGLVFQRGMPPAAEYLFKHALVRDTAYSTLLRRPRKALHRRIAEALEQRFPDLVETRPEIDRALLRRSRHRRQGDRLLAPRGQIVGGQVSRA